MSVRSPVLPSSFQTPCPHTHEHESSLGTLMPDEAGREEAVCALEVCHGVWPSLSPAKPLSLPLLRQKMENGRGDIGRGRGAFVPLMSAHSDTWRTLQHAFDAHVCDVEQFRAIPAEE